MRILFIAAFILASSSVMSDQSDPRLEDLFDSLKSEKDMFQAAGIAERIWQIWIEHEDSQASGLMLRGTQQMNANDLYGALDTFDRLITLKQTRYYLLGDGKLRGFTERY
jgi:hypothetical protein